MSTNESVSTKKDLKGIGGWLLLFCLGLMVIGPQSAVQAINVVWEKVGPHPFPALRAIAIIFTCESVFIGLYAFVVGVLIWRGNKRGRNIARIYLVIRLVLDVLTFALLVAWAHFAFGPIIGRKMASTIGPTQALEAGVMLAWFAYFTYSKRVRNTYCREETA